MKRWLLFWLMICIPAFAQLPTTPLGNVIVEGNLSTKSPVANAIAFGADRTGATDSSAAINAAIAYGLTFTPAEAVYLPAGTYRVAANSLNLGSTTQGQCIVGDGTSTQITIGPDFNTTATGVIVPAILTPAAGQSGQRHCIRNLGFSFQPLDNLTTTATAQSLSGANTITVASTAGIVPGNVMYVTDNNNSAIPILLDTLSISSTTGTTVTSVNAGTGVVTLSINLLGTVNIGDTITFASVRSRYAALGTCTITPGGTGCKYPWAISAGTNIDISNVNVNGAWDGVSIVGSQWTISGLNVGALDVGLFMDQAFGFPTLTNYVFGQNVVGFGGTANEQPFYDGGTFAVKGGEVQGLVVTNLQSWTGMVELGATPGGWQMIDNLALDGSNSNLVLLSGWTKIGNMYSTKGANSHGTPIAVSGGQADISNIYLTSSYPNPAVTVTGGSLSIMGGYTWYGDLASPFMSVTGGELDIGNVQLDAGGIGGGQYYAQQSGASGVLKVNGAKFISEAHGVGFGIATDNAADQVTNVSFNGWLFGSPGPLGTYGPNSISVLIADTLFDTALGTNSGHAITTGSQDTFVGFQAGQATTTGVDNTFVGTNAGLSNTTGTWNTAVGVSALQVGTVTVGNAAFGMYALTGATGTSNTALGFQAGKSLTTGSNNTIVGNSVASTTLATGSDNILIGTTSGLDTAAAGTSNTISIGGIFTATGTNVPATSIASVSGAFGVTGAATFNGTVTAGSSPGLSCSGTPTSSFATVNGIVTHC